MQTSQSRLKCRKVLGMGESSDGQFHRSKISQLLGRDSMTTWHMSTEDYPFGLQLLQRFVCSFLLLTGMMSMMWPNQVHGLLLSTEQLNDINNLISSSDAANNQFMQRIGVLKKLADVEARMFASLLLTIGLYYVIILLWNGHSRRSIRISLIVNVCISTVLLTVSFWLLEPTPPSSGWIWKLLLTPNALLVGVIALSVYYYQATGRDKNYNKIRRSTAEYSE